MRKRARVVMLFSFIMGLYLYGGIMVSKPQRISNGVWPVWSPDGEKIAYKEGRSIYLMDWDGSNKRVLLKADTLGGYGVDFYWSPDGKCLLTYWMSSRRDGPSNDVVINIETGEVKRYPAVLGGTEVAHPDSTLFWDLSNGHKLILVPDKEWGRVDSLLREQKHHWPEWVKKDIKSGREIMRRFREAKREKRKIMGYKEPEPEKVPGRAYTKVLERDEEGYVKKAQLWAYPEGGKPYLAMSDTIFGSVVCFSPNHKYMIIVGKDNNLYIAHADGSDVMKVTENMPEDYVFGVISWSSDSKKFVYDGFSKKYPDKGRGIWLVKIEE